MNPESLLVLAPVLGLGAFLAALNWPVEDEDGGHGLGVPDREIRPQRGVPEDTETDSQDEEEQQTMNYDRSEALAKALEWANGANVGAEKVLEVAEKFRAFLAGEDAKPNPATFPVVPANLVFGFKTEEQPSWVYFRYRASKNIYYRSDINKPSTELGNLQRKGGPDHEWGSVDNSVGNPMTRAELRERKDEYIFVPRSHVPTEYLW